MSGAATDLTHLQEALAAYGRGELDTAAARHRLASASAATGRSGSDLLAALAGTVPLSAEQRAALLEGADSERPSASPLSSTDGTESTRVTAAAWGTGEERTRVRTASAAESGPDGAGGTDSAPPTSGPSGAAEDAEEGVAPGRVLKGRFVLEELIGHGGMGTVYRARDLRKVEAQDSDPYVALKLLNDDFRRHPDALIALQREARKAQTLAHPNVVTVHDFDRDGSTVFLSMEYLRGRPLDGVIRDRGGFGLPPKEALRIIDRMARGLAYAHQEGFVHADFKPGNVFLNEGGNVKILDFGIARAATLHRGDPEQGRGDHTRFDPGSIGAVTPAYASPEMLRGNAAEPADDVYGLACVAYELLTGRHPFLDERGRKLPADEAERLGLRPAPPRGLPKRVSRALARGLAWRREERFADAGKFLDAIKRPVRIRRTVLAAMVLLAAFAATSWWITIRESNIIVSVDDLAPALSDSRDLILRGDDYLADDELAQAHKSYAQAWESAQQVSDVPGREQSRLRALVERRMNDVIDRYIARARDPEATVYSLELLRLTLESLGRHELGSRDEAIRDALEHVNQRLEQEARQ
ncbi:serine/threonine-protein kinase [Spiribacter halobius]|uniref:serine/threonine-protein kinase n=1 Tax=Sediminicurvatus halobius TaxID=2182432 RepID=UPI0018EE7A75|nr:serine/threonine-protein kinase [Spiribacter halobius]UEX76653.1 serine/threonine protein kinase [Spiribacter halobius]